MEAFENVACLSLVRAFFPLVGEPCILMGAHLRIDGVESPPKSRYIMHVGVIQSLFLSGHVYLVGVWLGEDQKTTP